MAMTAPKRNVLAGLCLVAVCAACSGGGPSLDAQQPQAPPAASAAAAPGDEPPPIPMKAIPMNEFMAHVISYSAFNIWNKQGWVSDSTGEHSLFPDTDEEWEDAESASLTLAELSGLLLQPDRRINVPGWDASALSVRRLARQAAAAAEKHDEAAFFDIGTELDEACESCHRAVGIVK